MTPALTHFFVQVGRARLTRQFFTVRAVGTREAVDLVEELKPIGYTAVTVDGPYDNLQRLCAAHDLDYGDISYYMGPPTAKTALEVDYVRGGPVFQPS